MSRSPSEHSFTSSTLISGEDLRSYTANGAISQGQAVKITGEYEVSPVNTAGEEGAGVALYDVADGQQVNVAMDGCEVRVAAGAACTVGARASVDAAGDFQDAGSATGNSVWGTFNTSAAAGETVELDLEPEREVS